MKIPRNDVMDALLKLLKDKNTNKLINTFSRRFVMPEKISGSAGMPYLCLVKQKEDYPQRQISALPAKRTFFTEILIWTQFGQNQKTTPDEQTEDILDYLDEALQPFPNGQAQTLGGLVDYCNIEGTISIVPGDLDGTGLIHVPVKIVLP